MARADYRCPGCEQVVDPDDQAVLLAREDLELHDGEARVVPVWRYAHLGHDADALATGFRYVRAGSRSALEQRTTS